MIIVAVDDELLQLERLENAIRGSVPNAELHCFREPEIALNYAKKNSIDVLFTDIRMPKIKGIELAKSIKQIHPKTNVIFCTAFSEYALEAVIMPISGFLLKPINPEDVKRMLDDLRYPVEVKNCPALRFQCFGNFEVYYNSNPVRFRYEKSKELLAYLVDRRGAMCSNGEIMSAIFEDEQKNDYLRKLKKDLVDTFEDIGLDNIVIKHYGSMAIASDRVICDYYSWLDGKPDGICAFFGEYMSQYSWAEDTNARLMQSDNRY